MGVGSWLSRFLSRGLVARFVTIELLVGLVGGFSSTILFLAFAYTGAFRLVLYVLVTVLGIFVGLEIPLLMRILKDRYAFKDVVANVLTFDYLGALAASLAFPILLVPKLGLVRSALLFGMINAARRALVGLALPRPPRRAPRARRGERRRAAAALRPAWRARRSSPTSPKTTSTPTRSSSRATRATSASCSPRGRTTSGSGSTRTSSSARATSTATTRRSCIPASRRGRARGACSSSAAATGSPCASC